MTRAKWRTAYQDEAVIERDIVQYLRTRGFLVLRTHGPRNRPAEEGIPDLLVYPPFAMGRETWIEVKAKGGRLSDDQAFMHDRLQDRGARVIVARSVEDVAGL